MMFFRSSLQPPSVSVYAGGSSVFTGWLVPPGNEPRCACCRRHVPVTTFNLRTGGPQAGIWTRSFLSRGVTTLLLFSDPLNIFFGLGVSAWLLIAFECRRVDLKNYICPFYTLDWESKEVRFFYSKFRTFDLLELTSAVWLFFSQTFNFNY